MKKIIFPISILVVLVIIGYIIIGQVSKPEAVKENSVNETLQTKIDSGPDKIFVLTGENYKFTMNSEESPELRVKQGDKIRIEFTSTSGFHDWVVDEFNAATEKVSTGSSTFVEFIADKKGTFEYYCSVGNHREQGMKGNFIVE
jgi:heme/copper-type cytochrome/quinol oxidase subunit 2